MSANKTASEMIAQEEQELKDAHDEAERLRIKALDIYWALPESMQELTAQDMMPFCIAIVKMVEAG